MTDSLRKGGPDFYVLERDRKDVEYFSLRQAADFSDTAREYGQAMQFSPWRMSTWQDARAYQMAHPDNRSHYEQAGQEELLIAAMTEEERSTYLYLHATQGREAADAYYDHLANDEYGIVTARLAQNQSEQIEALAKAHPVLASVESVLLSPGQVLGSGYSIAQRLQGREINPNSMWFGANRFVQGTRETVKEEINAYLGENTLAANSATFMYDVLMGAGDSAMSAVLGGGQKWASILLMSAQGASGAIEQAKVRGASDTQALALGGATMLAEIMAHFQELLILFLEGT